ncbi:MAG: cytochrome c3 family protein [Candidatus Sulfobium sp.]
MKRLSRIALCIAVAVLTAATTAFAISSPYTGEYGLNAGQYGEVGTAGAGINGTVHDLRRANTQLGLYQSNPNDYLDRICIFCHAPHHTYRLTTAGATGSGPLAPANATYLPLWNHTITTTVFQPYYNGPGEPSEGAKRSQAIDYFDKIGAASLLCLSCHDGSIAVNEYGHFPQSTKSQSAGGTTITPEYKIGAQGYLANHHLIGFDYASVAAVDYEIYQADTAVFDQSLDGGTNIVPVSQLLWNGKMECSTCHAVHNKGNTGEKLLYVSNMNSNLCLSCHNKGIKAAIIAP